MSQLGLEAEAALRHVAAETLMPSALLAPVWHFLSLVLQLVAFGESDPLPQNIMNVASHRVLLFRGPRRCHK